MRVFPGVGWGEGFTGGWGGCGCVGLGWVGGKRFAGVWDDQPPKGCWKSWESAIGSTWPVSN